MTDRTTQPDPLPQTLPPGTMTSMGRIYERGAQWVGYLYQGEIDGELYRCGPENVDWYTYRSALNEHPDPLSAACESCGVAVESHCSHCMPCFQKQQPDPLPETLPAGTKSKSRKSLDGYRFSLDRGVYCAQDGDDWKFDPSAIDWASFRAAVEEPGGEIIDASFDFGSCAGCNRPFSVYSLPWATGGNHCGDCCAKLPGRRPLSKPTPKPKQEPRPDPAHWDAWSSAGWDEP